MNKHNKTVWCGETTDDVLIETVPGREAWKIVPAEVNHKRGFQLLEALADALNYHFQATWKGPTNEDQD